MSMSSCTGEPTTGPSAPDVSHQCWAERKDHPLWPAGNALPNAAQDDVCLCHKGTLLAHTHCHSILSTKTPRTFSEQLLSSRLAPSMCGCLHLFLPRWRTWPSLCWTSWGSCWAIPPACWGPSKWQHAHLVYQSRLPVSHHLQTCLVFNPPCSPLN